MQTGIKGVDQLIAKHGIKVDVGFDDFQRRSRLTGGDERAQALPFCMYQKVMNAPLSRMFTVHHFYMPDHKGKLASFLFNEKGELIEQVYYQKVARWVNVCRKLQQWVQTATSDMQMAA
ncbi:hypothetical protein D210916BOD24_16710 [Alteromonas sp. D210916BOD_24]|uniref:hypothetical protein n=1 Tax=Alteromonas sp. D210916BOD_24 TaxID=3157618 RepID=UPI00399CBFBE